MARRTLIRTAAALLLTALSSTASLAEETTVKIGWLRSSLSLALHPIAIEEGFYARQGIAPKVTVVRSGDGALGTQLVMSRDLDFYIGTVSDIARLNSQAIDAKQKPILTVFAVGAPGATHLVVKKGLEYKSVADLKGLRIGVTSPGSTHIITFRHYLGDQGTSLEGLAVKLVTLSGDDMPAALLSGQIDAFLHSQPTPSIAVANGAGRIALAPSDMGVAGASPNVGLIARADWAQSNPEIVRKMVTALREASIAYPSIPKERVVSVAVKYLGGDPELVLASYPYVDPRLVVDQQKGADIYWSVEMAAMKTRGEVSPGFEQKDMFNFSYAR